MMSGILIICLLLLATALLIVFRRLRKLQRYEVVENQVTTEVLRNVAAYVLLIDDEFNVRKTNYYILTGEKPAAHPVKVGNLLHCRNGVNAGECGKHDLCATCPVRSAINQAFMLQGKFSQLEAEVTLTPTDSCEHTIDRTFSFSGNYLEIRGDNCMILTIYDITAQKQIQKELEIAKVHAEESDRMKSLFLANTTHELRTPLNAIVGFSELLASSNPTTDERCEYVKIVRANNEVLLQLVNDILDLSKIEAGTLEYHYSEVELNALMSELYGLFSLQIPATSTVELILENTAQACKLKTDSRRLMQVLSNLLSNALKFTTEGTIRFGYRVEEEQIYFYCEDTGCGMCEEQVKNLFVRFSKQNTQKHGVGIGLAISRSIVETLGGHVAAESEVGKGSKLWFTLPRSPKQPLEHLTENAPTEEVA